MKFKVGDRVRFEMGSDGWPRWLNNTDSGMAPYSIHEGSIYSLTDVIGRVGVSWLDRGVLRGGVIDVRHLRVEGSPITVRPKFRLVDLGSHYETRVVE